LATSIVETQLAELQRLHPAATAVELPDGSTLVTVPDIPMPAGWNQDRTAVVFLTPVGYPMARPDCFWADCGLRLSGGGMPGNANLQSLPGRGDQVLWFSWHLAQWDPQRDTLLTFVRVIRSRFVRAQ
jgi:hypothetical protein